MLLQETLDLGLFESCIPTKSGRESNYPDNSVEFDMTKNRTPMWRSPGRLTWGAVIRSRSSYFFREQQLCTWWAHEETLVLACSLVIWCAKHHSLCSNLSVCCCSRVLCYSKSDSTLKSQNCSCDQRWYTVYLTSFSWYLSHITSTLGYKVEIVYLKPSATMSGEN